MFTFVFGWTSSTRWTENDGVISANVVEFIAQMSSSGFRMLFHQRDDGQETLPQTTDVHFDPH
jgi:hypothetical protein